MGIGCCWWLLSCMVEERKDERCGMISLGRVCCGLFESSSDGQ